MKTEQIIFPSHIIYLTEGSKKERRIGTGNRKNLRLPANLSFALRSSILSAPLNLVLPQTGQQRPSAIGNKWSGLGGATTHGRRRNTIQLLGFTLCYRSGLETFGRSCFQKYLSNDPRQDLSVIYKRWSWSKIGIKLLDISPTFLYYCCYGCQHVYPSTAHTYNWHLAVDFHCRDISEKHFFNFFISVFIFSCFEVYSKTQWSNIAKVSAVFISCAILLRWLLCGYPTATSRTNCKWEVSCATIRYLTLTLTC